MMASNEFSAMMASNEHEDGKPQILPTALPTWNSAKDDLIAEAETKLRANHLKILKLYKYVPAWSLGMEALPGFLKPFIGDIIQLKRTQALDLLSLIENKLEENTQHYASRAQAQYTSLEHMYRAQNDDEKGWNIAKDLLGALIDIESTKYTEDLEHDLKYIQDHPIKDDDLKQFILEGPKKIYKHHKARDDFSRRRESQDNSSRRRKSYLSSRCNCRRYPPRDHDMRRRGRQYSRSASYRNNVNAWDRKYSNNNKRNQSPRANSHYN